MLLDQFNTPGYPHFNEQKQTFFENFQTKPVKHCLRAKLKKQLADVNIGVTYVTAKFSAKWQISQQLIVRRVKYSIIKPFLDQSHLFYKILTCK